MSHPSDHDTTPANDPLSPKDASANAILDRLDEAAFYATIAAMTADDPYAAQRMMLERNVEPIYYPPLREQAFASIKRRIADVAAAAAAELPTGPDAPGGERDQARQASFRANPGWHLPGAEPAPVQQLKPDGIDYVLLDGLVYPWTYASRSYVTSDLGELVAFAEREGYGRGILVGAPELKADLEGIDWLPPGFILATVDMAFFDLGRRA
ncbi:hypothetical protein ASG63_08515 [Methylobacterium sp. Leaf94]|uniref:hypothetical protein n=1 Tax=Methylobacterium sp. Leaf94 TaxID=1736250 RepID=UPI0006F63669|nr:hypothetical protein [Methylobacterium sp. Leaf94]KQU17544.1 hypothetical protein ASG63_08515 [Methylobacterium sp. Leaf94]